jgi:hypothetical protein
MLLTIKENIMTHSLSPLPGFEALPGCHCVTSSYRKVCAYNHYPISEEMLLGLGAGAGFVYWHARGQVPFLGGRGNPKDFARDISRRTGVVISEHYSASPRAAEKALLALLDAGQPVVVGVDMPFMPYLGLPAEAHFGGHAVVVCGYDPAARLALIADMEPQQTGYKEGTLNAISLDQLATARGSKYQPFPPRNLWCTFDFTNARPPQPADVCEAIAQAAQPMLHPPIQNVGVAGIRTAAARAKDWAKTMTESELRLSLFNAYVFVEIGGSGGGLFRSMYARFLEEAAALTGLANLNDAARAFHACAARWSAVAQPLANAYQDPDPQALLPGLSEGLLEIYELESSAWGMLA